MSWRPDSIAEIARRASNGSDGFDASVREFLDEWLKMSRGAQSAAIAEEPRLLNPVEDAYLAALAEHLALQGRISPPAWTDAPNRFLREPFFAGGLESLKAILIVESPAAFRRRLLFITADGLFRPHAALVEET